ncbi:unnamed protein product, partial [marine sediment metagenome]
SELAAAPRAGRATAVTRAAARKDAAAKERTAAQEAVAATKRAAAAGAAPKRAAAKSALAAEETRAAAKEHPSGIMPGERGGGGGPGDGPASLAFRADRNVVLAAVQQSGLALEFASLALRADREVVLAAVQQSGFALEFASLALRADRAVVLAAVLQEAGGALEFASETLQAGPGIRVAAHFDGLDFALDELRADPDVASMSSGRTRTSRLRPCGVTGLRSGSFRGRFAGTGAWCWRRCEGPGPLSSFHGKAPGGLGGVLAAMQQDGGALSL